jgi:ATP-binding cassette subfamily F protein uup
MTALTAQHLHKSFGPQVVLDDATFTLDAGERVGLIGANGAGKSTLARILVGLELPDAGTVSRRRGLAVRYLAQEPELAPGESARAVVEGALTAWRAATERHAALTAELSERTGTTGHDALVTEQAELADTIVALGGWDREHEALRLLHLLGVKDVERPCGERSGGERRRIALAQLLVASPDVAILDEPTNHLDADTAAWLEGYLAREFRGAIVLVTHDRYFLDGVAQRIIELERGRLTAFAGGYTDYLEKKAEFVAHEERVEQNRQNLLRREREWLARGPKARATKQKARIQRAQALEGSGLAARPGEVTLASAASTRQGKTILEFRAAQVAVAAGAPALIEPLDLVVNAGERIGIVGPNGAGKTTLVRAVLAAIEGASLRVGGASVVGGAIVVGKNTRVAYLDQARANLDDDKSIFDDVRGETGSTVVDLGVRGGETMDLRSYLELFLFDGHKQRQKVGALSGGERARVALAKVLRAGANLLLFDEPTNDLDLPTLAVLESVLEAFEGSAMVVTHDRAFLDRVATAILAFEPDAGGSGRATLTRYAGGYEDYVTQRSRSQLRAPAGAPSARATPAATTPAATTPAATTPAATTPAAKGDRPSAKPVARRALTYSERLELDGIVEAIETAERGVAEVSALLADPLLYAKRGHEVTVLQVRLERARAEAARLVERWESLEDKRGEPRTTK